MRERPLYISKIQPFFDKPIVKVITGIRRCGKSALLMLIKDYFIKTGITEKNIIYINFESMEYSDIDSAKKLYSYILDKKPNEGRCYILLDEIQNVKEWERAVNSFQVDFDSDIYITGSNSQLLSSELSTLLAGRYVEFVIETLSFKEYLSFLNETPNDIYKAFNQYVRLGGFPAIHAYNYDTDSAYKVINDIYSSVILRDTIQRHNIRNVDQLERIMRFILINVGNIFSAKSISDYFVSQKRKVDINTIYNYLSALESAYIIRRVNRYNLKGKEILKTNEKYYFSDHALIYSLMGYNSQWISGVLENIVFLEMLRRGYTPFVGKYDDYEIDFVGDRQGNKIYVQVTYKIESQKTFEREINSLMKVNDNYHKYLVTTDEMFVGNYDGIEEIHIADFLLKEDW
ncbi:MAG: ATP-binding protein [Bacteroidales bacterium]|nr:ATP-binding protein [Bacteroidales bacterium]